MLARLAENLFWAGRHLERAEDTARLIDVTYHGLLEAPFSEGEQAWAQVLEALSLSGLLDGSADELNGTNVLSLLVLGKGGDGSMISAVRRVRENLRSVREIVSSELWEAVNGFHLELQARDLAADIEQHPFELLGLVRRRCQAFAGVVAETMARDDGWRFLTLGRMLERAELTIQLLDVRIDRPQSPEAPLGFHHWVGLLKSAGALEAYRKAYGAPLSGAHVLELLLLSHECPRSVLFCLRAANAALRRLASPDTTLRSQRLLGRACAELRYGEVQEILDGDVHDFLGSLREVVRDVADAATDEFFRHGHQDLHAVGGP